MNLLWTILLRIMSLQNIILFIFLFILCGCSDYPAGYRDGYGDIDEKKWIVFGRGEYQRGFHSGQAEKFQEDWLLENPIEPDLLYCPSNIVRADPLMFLPKEFKEIAQDIYSSEL
jgi:hypothetical protein